MEGCHGKCFPTSVENKCVPRPPPFAKLHHVNQIPSVRFFPVIGALPVHREPVSRRFPFELCHFDHLGLLERETPRTILL